MVCDFCNDPDAKWDYPAKSFTIAIPILGVVWGSEEGWAACNACRALIERGDKAGLFERSRSRTSAPRGIHPAIDAAMDAADIELHEKFHANRLGPGKPIAIA